MGKISAVMHWLLGLALVLGLAGCASEPMQYASLPNQPALGQTQEPGQAPLQCVPYARDHSGVKIFGDAYTWWDQAAGKYAQNALPQTGAVMVLTGYAGPDHGHVAVVREIVSPREIRVDHANWLDDGSVYLNDPVQDVSRWNDWSQVRVFNIKTGAWGAKTYPVQGFIGGMPDQAPAVVANRALPDLLARIDSLEKDK